MFQFSSKCLLESKAVFSHVSVALQCSNFPIIFRIKLFFQNQIRHNMELVGMLSFPGPHWGYRT